MHTVRNCPSKLPVGFLKKKRKRGERRRKRDENRWAGKERVDGVDYSSILLLLARCERFSWKEKRKEESL